MTKEQKQALKEAEKEQKPFTLEERIEKTKIDIQRINAEVNRWQTMLLKNEGALELLEIMLKEQTDKT